MDPRPPGEARDEALDAFAPTVHDPSAAQATGRSTGTLAPGVEVGPYRIQRELGRGGMGVVFLAEETALRRSVALKILTGSQSLDRSALERFRREARLVAAFRCEHVVRVLAAGDLEGRPYLAMEHVEGVPLSEEIARGPLAPRRAAEVARQVALGLAYAHERGVVHRDVKPANVMVQLGPDGRDRALVLDFGLARGPTDATVTRSGCLLGTPAYMPPEQARGDPVEVDARSDVYSLGATLFHMLVGRPVHQAQTLERLVLAIATREPIPPRRLRPSVPRDLESICLQMLAREPEGRYPTAREAADDLARFLAGEPVAARRPGLVVRGGRFASRHRILLVAGALVLAAAGLALVFLRERAAAAREETAEATTESRERQRAIREALVELGSIRQWAAKRGLDQEATVRERFDRLIAQVPDQGFPWRERGLWYFDQCENDPAEDRQALAEAGARARSDLARALELDPDDRNALEYLFAIDMERSGLEAALQAVPASGGARIPAYAAFLDASRLEARGDATRRRSEAEGWWRQALTGYDRCLGLDPEFLWAHLRRGIVKDSLGDPAGALEDFEEFLIVRPRNALGLCHRALALIHAGEKETGAAELLLLTHRRPWFALAWRVFGSHCSDENHLVSAKDALDRAIQLDPADAGALAERGVVQARMGDVRSARADLDQAIALDPMAASAFYDRGVLRARSGDSSGALEDFDRAIALDDEQPDFHCYRAAMLESSDRVPEAVVALDRAIELDPLRHANYYLMRGRCRLALEDAAGALPDLTRATELAPEDPLPPILFAQAHVRLGDVEAALADLEAALRRNPDSPEALVLRGLVRDDRGDRIGARADLARALELDPSLPESGRIAETLRRIDEELGKR